MNAPNLFFIYFKMKSLGFFFILTLVLGSCTQQHEVEPDIYEYEYFGHLNELSYPDELKTYSEYHSHNPFHSSGNPPRNIISFINRMKEYLGNHMEKLRPKAWWTPIDTVLVNSYGAELSNSQMYHTSSTVGWSFIENYMQITDYNDVEYFLSIHQRVDVNTNAPPTVFETSWQNKEKTQGKIERVYDPIVWKYTIDSLQIDNNGRYSKWRLRLKTSDYSGTITRYGWNDSIYRYTWRGDGKGSYSVTHKTNGQSINPDYQW